MGRRDLGGGASNCSWHPPYEVTNQHRWSWVLHQNQLLLIASEVGIPLCIGNCHTQDRLPVPPHARLPPLEVMKRGHHKRKMARQSPDDPTSKASLGWKNGKLQLRLWTSTGVSTEDGWRPQVKWFSCRSQKEHLCKAEGWCLYPLMLVDSEPKGECYHSLNLVKVGKAKQKYVGGVKRVSKPHVGVKDEAVYHSDMECSYLPRGTYPIIEEWHCTLRRT